MGASRSSLKCGLMEKSKKKKKNQRAGMADDISKESSGERSADRDSLRARRRCRLMRRDGGGQAERKTNRDELFRVTGRAAQRRLSQFQRVEIP